MSAPVFRQRRLYQEVASHLGERIRGGEFTVGAALPGENTLARDYGVSRNVMREALVALEILGLVTVRAGAGAFVNEGASLIEVSLGRIGVAGGPSPLAVLEARRSIEGEVAFHAATNASDTDLARLEMLLETVRRGTKADLARADWPAAFHLALARATGNAVFETMVGALWQAVRGPMFEGLRAQVSLDQIQSRLATRQRIFDAVRAKDPEAARAAMHAHIDMVGHDLFGDGAPDPDAPRG